MEAMTQPLRCCRPLFQHRQTNYIYVAHKVITLDRVFYLRLAMSLESVMEHFYELWIQLVGAFGVLVVISNHACHKISKKTHHDIFPDHPVSGSNFGQKLPRVPQTRIFSGVFADFGHVEKFSQKAPLQPG